MLMLGLSVISFSALYYYVMSAPTPNPSPIVEISGMLDENEIVLMHRGGETLSLNTELLVTVGGLVAVGRARFPHLYINCIWRHLGIRQTGSDAFVNINVTAKPRGTLPGAAAVFADDHTLSG